MALYIVPYVRHHMLGVMYIYFDIVYMYLVYDVIMRSMCTIVLWHIWRCYAWYVCSIYIICFSRRASCTCCNWTLPYLDVSCKINLSSCNLKLKFNSHSINSIKSYLALNCCSTAHNRGGWVVDWLSVTLGVSGSRCRRHELTVVHVARSYHYLVTGACLPIFIVDCVPYVVRFWSSQFSITAMG